MISTQLKKCLVVSVSALSALGLVTLMPHGAIAQTSGQTQTGVEGSQTNPGSTEGSGQVVPPTNTTEGMSDTMTPSTTGTGSSSDSNIDTIEDTGAANTRDSNTGRGEVLDPAMENGSGTMTPGSMGTGTRTMTPASGESNIDVIEGDGASGARDSDTGRGEVLSPEMENGSGTMTPGSMGTGSSTTPTTTMPATTTPTTTPARTTAPTPSSSPRALW